MEKGRVVVIDDSAIVRKLAQIALEEEGYTVYTAEDGEQGYKVAEEIRPSLILVDFIMPKVSGYQVCKMVRENEAIKDTPIILITGKGDEAGRKFTEKFGVLDYFVKPFRSEALIEKVNSILQPSEGFPLDDVVSFESVAGIEPEAPAPVTCSVETYGETVGPPDYDRPPERPSESLAGPDPNAEYESASDYLTAESGEQMSVRLGSGADLDGGVEPADPGFLRPEDTPEALSFDSSLDLDSLVPLSHDESAVDEGGFEIAPLSIPEEFREGPPDPLSINGIYYEGTTGEPVREMSPSDEGHPADLDFPQLLSQQSDDSLDLDVTGCTPVTLHDHEGPDGEPSEETLQRIASQAAADLVDARLSAFLEDHDSRIRSLLKEVLEGGLVEAAVEKVLSRHFSTTLASMLQDSTAEALTLLKEPPGQEDIERIIERVVSHHFKENISTIISETSAVLGELPGKAEIAGTIESAIAGSQIRQILSLIEENLTEIREDLKGFAGSDEISDILDRALLRSFPEGFANSMKDDMARLVSASNELPRSGDLEKAVEERLRGHVPGIVQTLLEQHTAELTRHISGLPGQAQIERILAALAAQNAPMEVLPQFTRSMEDMLKQHGMIKAPGIILSGDTAHLDLAEVLGMITARGLTGRLSVYSISLSSEIYLNRGTLCYASTSRQGRDPVIGKMLSAGRGSTDGATSDEWDVLRLRIQTAVQDTLAIREGKFYFEQGPVPAQLEALTGRVDAHFRPSGSTAAAMSSSAIDCGGGHGEGCYTELATSVPVGSGE